MKSLIPICCRHLIEDPMTRANLQPAEQQGIPANCEAALNCDFRDNCCDSPAINRSGGRIPCALCPKSIVWTWSSFEDLGAPMLYAALRLRQDIFIVEQNVPYPDIDGRDLQSMHLLGTLNGELVAYLRALPCGLFEPGYSSFGRVVVGKKWRGLGMGRKLVEQCIERFDGNPNRNPLKISSQIYLKDFYSDFDFIPTGEPYIEDEIPHIAMIRS